MRSLRIIAAVFLKEVKDIARNYAIIVVSLALPVISFALFNIIPVEAAEFVRPAFISMHIVFSPIICIASIIGEEKEKHTLKDLMISNVSPIQYLLGIGLVVMLLEISSSLLFLFHFTLSPYQCFRFLLLSWFGSSCSILVGSIIGIYAKNQASASALAAVIGMVLGMSPMFSNFSESIHRITSVLYSQRIADSIKAIDQMIATKSLVIIILNGGIFLVLFAYIYRMRLGIRKKYTYL